MPNKTIYLDTIKEMEQDVGHVFIDKDAMAEKLQDAWKNDTTQAKLNYLGVYRGIFRDVLKIWTDKELSVAFYARSEKMANFKKALLKTDETLKMCAMALIPELRENEDILSHMTFGVIQQERLKNECISARSKYLGEKESENAMKKRKAESYDKYKAEWQNVSTRKITTLVWDKDALHLMSKDEKIDYALALDTYRNDPNPIRPLDTREQELIDEALLEWKKEFGCAKDDALDKVLVNEYFQYAGKLGDNEWIDREVEDAIAEYNKTHNRAKEEIAQYKETEKNTAEFKRISEQTERNAGVTDDTAEMLGEFFAPEEQAYEQAMEAKRKKHEGITDETAEMLGDFFMQEELTLEVEEAPLRKERMFLEEKVTDFNKKYSLRVNKDKLFTSVEQVSALMIKAREEKELFMSKDNVVEKCYTVNEYFKDVIEKANKEHAEELDKIEKERKQVEKERKEVLEKIAKQNGVLDQKTIENMQADAEKDFQKKKEELEKRIAEAKEELEDALAGVQGGVVFEKNGKEIKKYKASQYYETHETQKEQYAYGEYQQMFSLLYRDACKNLKEKNYPTGKVTDFSTVASDVDKLFKSAMYISNIYDNDKNIELMQKCSFGGFSAEQLATFATNLDGDSWSLNQSSETVWAKQATQAKSILSGWVNEEKINPKVKPADRIKTVLDEKRTLFTKGKITQKEMLDYMLAADSHLQNNFPTRMKRFWGRSQYNREKNALKECRNALGLTENDSLRVAMNNEYSKQAGQMSKEEVFKSIGAKMNATLTFQAEKDALAKEHQTVQDRVVAEKVAKLEDLKAKDREPISIPALDERKVILNQEPRVKPVQPVVEVQRNLNLNQ